MQKTNGEEEENETYATNSEAGMRRRGTQIQIETEQEIERAREKKVFHDRSELK